MLSNFIATDIDGHSIPLSRFAGKVLLIVNTASKCGFTPQYEGLQKLHDDYGAQGFEVLGFPSNQFFQEPGSSDAIQDFCTTEYKVSFPMFGKVNVNGSETHPFFAWLKQEAPGILGSTPIKWNFTKFLLDRSGKPTVRYAPTMAPHNIAPTIERLLRQ